MIHVLIADDHPVIRAGLRDILGQSSNIEIVGEATDGSDVVAKVLSTTPDVVLLDLSMPGPPFVEVLRQLRQQHPALRVLVLSVHPERQYARRALRAGAAGYLTKDRSPKLLLEAIDKVARGERYISDDLAAVLLNDGAGHRPHPAHDVLSEREYEILCLLGDGKSVKEIAGALSISPKTVSTYRTRVFRKMRLKTNADLIRYVVEHRLSG
jgi:two-component system, NarL family, invasion response regulator UvrY